MGSWPPTGSAPDVMWAVIDPTVLHEGYADADGIMPTGLVEHTTDEARARRRAADRDEALNRQRPERRHLPVEYVRKDVADAERYEAVPTVNEMARKIRELGWVVGEQNGLRMAHALRPWLLSRIEGDGRAACSEGDNDEA